MRRLKPFEAWSHFKLEAMHARASCPRKPPGAAKHSHDIFERDSFEKDFKKSPNKNLKAASRQTTFK